MRNKGEASLQRDFSGRVTCVKSKVKRFNFLLVSAKVEPGIERFATAAVDGDLGLTMVVPTGEIKVKSFDFLLVSAKVEPGIERFDTAAVGGDLGLTVVVQTGTLNLKQIIRPLKLRYKEASPRRERVARYGEITRSFQGILRSFS